MQALFHALRVMVGLLYRFVKKGDDDGESFTKTSFSKKASEPSNLVRITLTKGAGSMLCAEFECYTYEPATRDASPTLNRRVLSTKPDQDHLQNMTSSISHLFSPGGSLVS